MAKTNFSKVEEALNLELFKMNVQNLFDLAEDSAAVKKSVESSTSTTEQARASAVAALQQELKLIHKKDRKVYQRLSLDRQELQNYFKNPSKLTPQEWEKIKQIKDKLMAYKKELREKLPKLTDDEVIAAQRTKHVNKRFNVNEKWLPLDTHADGIKKKIQKR